LDSDEDKRQRILQQWQIRRYPVPIKLLRLVGTCRICGCNQWWEDGSISSLVVARCTKHEPPPKANNSTITIGERVADPRALELVMKGVRAWNDEGRWITGMRPRLANLDLAWRNYEGVDLSTQSTPDPVTVRLDPSTWKRQVKNGPVATLTL